MSNSNNDQRPGVAVGFILGFALCIAVFNLPWTDNYKAQTAVQECEKTIPRNQHCVIIAIPENEPVASNRT